MNVKKVILVLGILFTIGFGLLVVLAELNSYIADPDYPYSYLTPSTNNKFVFVMIGPKADIPTDSRWPDKDMERTRQIQSQYATSGLYTNDGSTKPLWEISEYSNKVFVSSDGVHLVRPAFWPSPYSDEALSFYENGKVVRSYRVKDLVDFPWFLPGGHGHFDWKRNITFDDQNGKLIVDTPHLDHYVFDLKTGNIVSARRPDRLIIMYSTLSLLALVIMRRRRSGG